MGWWRHGHLSCMVLSYYMLVGGGVNEFYLRIEALHALAPDVLNSPLVGLTHFAVVLIFIVALIYFNLRYRQPRLPP